MKASVTGKVPRLKAYKGNLEKARMEILVSAARVLVVKGSGSTPVLTGMARGTWVALGRYVNVVVPISPKLTNVPGRNASEGAKQSAFDFSVSGSTTSFNWSSTVYHQWLNDQFKVARVASSPWNSLEKGVRAARISLLNNWGPVIANAVRISIKK